MFLAIKTCQAQAMTIFTDVSQEHYNRSRRMFWALAYVKTSFEKGLKNILPFGETKALLLGDQLSSTFRQSGSRKDLQQPSFSHILYPAHSWLQLTIYSLPSAAKPHFQTKTLFCRQGRLTWHQHAPHRHREHANSYIKACWDNSAKDKIEFLRNRLLWILV